VIRIEADPAIYGWSVYGPGSMDLHSAVTRHSEKSAANSAAAKTAADAAAAQAAANAAAIANLPTS
jgi:hypothetical protein